MTTELTPDFLQRAAVWLDWASTPDGLNKREADLDLIQELMEQTRNSATSEQQEGIVHFSGCH